MSCLLFYISTLSLCIYLLLVEDTFCHLIVNEENDVTSINNNDELSYFYCQSLPWVNSVEALRGCASARL